MKFLVILAHPNQQSFNHAIASTAVSELESSGAMIYFHDLYQEKFDPLLSFPEFKKEAHLPPDLATYCSEIAQSDGIVIIHPNWWGQPPAILKGWIDRVLRPGVAYEFLEGDSGEGIPVGLLKAQVAIVFNTSNTPVHREIAVFGDPLERLWKNCIFELCGIKNFYRENFGVIVTSTFAQRQAWLARVKAIINQYNR